MATSSDENASKFYLKCCLSHQNALDVSKDSMYAISSDCGIYIVECWFSPSINRGTQLKLSILSNELTSVPIIPRHALNLATPSNGDLLIRRQNFTDEEEVFVTIDKWAGDHNQTEVQAGVRVVRWAPTHHTRRNLLACLTEDCGLCLLQQPTRHRHSWTCASNIGQKYVNREHHMSWPHSRLAPTQTHITQFRLNKAITDSVSATGVEWSPLFHASTPQTIESFSLLTVAMNNFDLVLWKVILPYNERRGETYLMTYNYFTSRITCLKWYPHITDNAHRHETMLAIGVSSGQIYVMTVNCFTNDEVVLSQPVTVWSDSDNMQPSCLAWTQINDNAVLLATKACIVTAFVISQDGTSVLNHTYIKAAYSLPCSGLSCMPQSPTAAALCSYDGTLHHLSVTLHQTQVSLTLTNIPFVIDTKSTWKCMGLSLSPNALFISVIAVRASAYNVREIREAAVILILRNPYVEPVRLINKYIASDTDSHHIHTDIYEYVRQSLVSQTQLPALTLRPTLPLIAWHQLPHNHLKLFRYVMLVERCIHKSSKKDIPDEVVSTRNEHIRHLTDMLMRNHVLAVMMTHKDLIDVDGISPQNKKSLNTMYNWWKSKKATYNWSETGMAQNVSTVINQLQLEAEQLPKCAICGLDLTFTDCDNITLTDTAGHQYGACGHTLLPCDSVDMRKCTVCLAAYTSIHISSDVDWDRCTLCDGPIK